MSRCKKLLSILIMTVMLMMAYMALGVSSASADTALFTGKQCTTDSYASSTIDYILAKYKDYSKYPGSGECWGYAEKVNSLLGAETSTKYYDGKRFSKKNVRELLKGCKAGTHVRLGYEKKFNGWYGHSIVLYKCTEDLVLWGQNNYTPGTVTYHVNDLEGFVDWLSQYPYINMIKKVTKYNHYSTPMLASDTTNGSVVLKWTKTTGTSNYKIYRATSENGSYKYLGSTKSYKYTSTSGTPGKKYYYKVKSIRSNGNRTSNVTSRTPHLKNPKVTLKRDTATGFPIITWSKVSHATKYKLYRFDYDEYKYKCIKTIYSSQARRYKDTKANCSGSYYDYKLVACNSKDKSTGRFFETFVSAGKPKNLTSAAEYGGIELNWDYPVNGYANYLVYRSKTGEKGTFHKIADIDYNSYFDSNVKNGQRYYYKVRPYVIKYNYTSSGYTERKIFGDYSRVVYRKAVVN